MIDLQRMNKLRWLAKDSDFQAVLTIYCRAAVVIR